MEGEIATLKTSSQNVENQLSQLISMMSNRPAGTLPSQPEPNPRESANAIMLRSGTRYEVPPTQEKETPNGSNANPTDGDSGKNSDKNSGKDSEPLNSEIPVEPYKPKIPFPQRLKNTSDPQFMKFLNLLKQVKINVPFVEAISQMPKYAKFLKDILSNKKKLNEFEMITLNEECSAIVLNKLPPKLKDPGSFTIPCTIGESHFEKALCDLGASINLMPFSVFKKLGMKEPKATTVSLQLADRSITYPRGVVEDVLVKVDKFIFPVDFIVLDMEEDENIPIILGRPFLATGRALVDVEQGKLTLRLGEENVVFDVFKALQHPSDLNVCNCITTVNSCVPLESVALQEKPIEDTVKKKSSNEKEGTTKVPTKKKKTARKRKKPFKEMCQTVFTNITQIWRKKQNPNTSAVKDHNLVAHGS